MARPRAAGVCRGRVLSRAERETTFGVYRPCVRAHSCLLFLPMAARDWLDREARRNVIGGGCFVWFWVEEYDWWRDFCLILGGGIWLVEVFLLLRGGGIWLVDAVGCFGVEEYDWLERELFSDVTMGVQVTKISTHDWSKSFYKGIWLVKVHVISYKVKKKNRLALCHLSKLSYEGIR